MTSSTVQTMPGPSEMPASPALSHSNSSFSLRNFVAEEDGFSAAMVKSADICTIALFEVLCSFDKEYAGFVANPPTREFIARTDKRTRAFEGMLVAASLSTASESESSSGSRIHPSIPRLFTVSHLPSVMYAFLSHTLGTERDWVVHGEIYVAMVGVIKHLTSSFESGSGGAGPAGVVREPVRSVEESCGVQTWMWDRGEVVWHFGGTYVTVANTEKMPSFQHFALLFIYVGSYVRIPRGHSYDQKENSPVISHETTAEKVGYSYHTQDICMRSAILLKSLI
ncbi:uncharacterized protein LACBIDRAFT_330675 [Laccaria bicolor S238N-H82]|uniref:Predicted protein n=1 Tax=Laccaria bicolor (strain S238N-H82 / ATCC MYA-4686) TaxID=486041 RepID=B0DM35_LACBS|nr:uncharacterized protein LACBIDRAFT_330675 [Laccaria bicolor S238N-H82]EDR04497.1 predicted protein [Laccaria bicolor S238N-H82]|eukprot:XP_001885016.1 predicted protein [Laccaria bicolor S238N-H82]